jgi:hypothetical protein
MESFKENEPIERLSKIKTSEINEVKNIKYKMNSKSLGAKSSIESTDLLQVELFLENEKKNNRSEPWNKLDKTTKYKKLEDFAKFYTLKHNLSITECGELTTFLKDAIDKKKIYKVKDILYDKMNSRIQDIPGLLFSKVDKKFTLKNVVPKTNTVRCTPKKNIFSI